MAEARLMQTVTNSEDLAILDSARNQVKKLLAGGFSEEESGRIILSSILKAIASRAGYELPFKDREIEKEIAELSIGSAELMERHRYFLDDLYQAIVSQTYRKEFGQFLTPPQISEFMVSWGMEGNPSNVLDPAVGTGVFLETVLRTGDCQVTGIDVDALALNTCALRLKLAHPSTTPNLTKSDFLHSNFMEANFDFVVCNPPYLNFHDFDGGLIQTIEQRVGFKLSKLTNIYPLFFFQAYAFLRKGGLMAFITPSEFFYTGYGKQLKSFLLDRFAIDAFVVTDFSKLAFPQALTTSVITLLRKVPADKGHEVKFIQVTEWPSSHDLLALVRGQRTELAGCRVSAVRQDRLDPDVKWQIYLGDNGLGQILKKLVPLSKVATANRGIATGANSFFAMSVGDVEKWGLDYRFLKPVIARASQAPLYDYTLADFESTKVAGERCFLLYCFDQPPPPMLTKYLEHGEELGIANRFLPSHRSPWYSSEKQKPAPILAMVFSREKMRFVFNEANLLTLTAYHCIYPYQTDELTVKALLAYLNSGLCAKIQEFMRREYGGGLHKFEPRDLEELLVLDVSRLADFDKAALASLFDELRLAARNNPLLEPAVKLKIDGHVRSIVG
jgi:adenine-specific DNA-methyltransferase